MHPDKRLSLPETPTGVLGCFWNPNAGFINELSDFLRDKKVLEIFAGNGYLAAYLAARGIAITPTSIRSSHDCHHKGFYTPVVDLSAVAAVAAFGDAHDTLVMSWPTVTKAVLHAVQLWGCEKDIVFIGEMTDYSLNHLGGCATDEFFEAITVTHRFTQYRPKNPLEHAVVCRLKPQFG